MASDGSAGFHAQIDALARVEPHWTATTGIAVCHRFLALDFENGGLLLTAKLYDAFVSLSFSFKYGFAQNFAQHACLPARRVDYSEKVNADIS